VGRLVIRPGDNCEPPSLLVERFAGSGCLIVKLKLLGDKEMVMPDLEYLQNVLLAAACAATQ